MRVKKVRNISFAPYLEKEGVFICPMPSPPPTPEGKFWFDGLKPHERLFYHQTLSSVRSCKRFIATPLIPRDSLDFLLQSRYDQTQELFATRADAVMQKESCPIAGADSTFRTLRNTKSMPIPVKDSLGHPLKIGGVKEKISPDSVKLINSGPHTQLVNNGYSRQPSDGNFFRY